MSLSQDHSAENHIMKKILKITSLTNYDIDLDAMKIHTSMNVFLYINMRLEKLFRQAHD